MSQKKYLLIPLLSKGYRIPLDYNTINLASLIILARLDSNITILKTEVPDLLVVSKVDYSSKANTSNFHDLLSAKSTVGDFVESFARETGEDRLRKDRAGKLLQ